VLGDEQLAFLKIQDLFECAHQSMVGSHASVKSDRFLKRLPPGNGALEIAGHGKTQTGDDVVHRRADLLEVDHIGLCEHTAPARDPRGPLRDHRQIPEFTLDREPHSRRLLVEEGSGPGRTLGIHGEIFEEDMAVPGALEGEELRVLSPHLDQCSNLGMELLHGLRLGHDLIDEFRTQDLGHNFSARPRDTDPAEPFRRKPAQNIVENPDQRLDGLSVEPRVVCLDDLVIRGHNDGVDAHGSDVQTQSDNFVPLVLHLRHPLSASPERDKESLVACKR